ncbi:MAG TPA: LapA family protein [Methylomirabilota bacterium]|nr:LapA family protein [Methylomirabilota bacterium]
MYLRTIFIVLILGAVALFAAANWQAFTAPTTLSLIVAKVEAPLGVILLGVILLLTALFLIYVAYLQSSVLLETRRHARELDAQRELAEHAEASRIHELRSSLEARLQALGKETQASLSELGARLNRLETDLRQSIEECQNTLAAILSEMDDRLRRATEPERQRRTE